MSDTNTGLRRVSSNPHVRSGVTTSNIMFWVAVSLLPAAGYGIYRFGVGALIVLALSVLSTVLSELIYEKAMKKLLYGSRDHARIPMQWDGSPNAGFSDAEPWIAVNPDHSRINAADEQFDAGSVLNYYRLLIGLRKDHPTLIYGSFSKISSGKDVLVYERQAKERFTVVINLTDRTVKRPKSISGERILSNYSTPADKLRPYEAEIYRG